MGMWLPVSGIRIKRSLQKDTSGKLTIVDQGFIQEAIEINAMIDTQSEVLVYETTQAWMTLRTEDTNFVLDTIISPKESESTSLFGLIDITKNRGIWTFIRWGICRTNWQN